MKEIIYTEHLILRLKLRKIPFDYSKMIYSSPEQSYYDVIEGNHIAIKKLKYNSRLRNMLIAYEVIDSEIRIITIHPITDDKINSRLVSGRWKNE